MTNSDKILILGIGNTLMGDEGIGVHVVRALEEKELPSNVECLDGGTGSFLLLEPMQRADKVFLIDATLDGGDPGTVQRIEPRFSTDYPATLTAHDIGLKDLLDVLYLLGGAPQVTLYAVSIAPLYDLATGLSQQMQLIVPEIAERVYDEVLVSN